MTDGLTPDPLIGQVVDDRYRVESLIAQGGMGQVYEASDVRFRRRLVLKTLIPEVAALEASFDRFLREARAAAQLGSAQIVGVQEFGRLPDGRAYLVMEHVDGRTLDQVLDGLNGPMPAGRALAIAHGLALAMEGPHRAGIVHRDLKPANVMLSGRMTAGQRQTDFVQVLDFGLAYVHSDNTRLTADGEIIGTPDYMAPEQCQEKPVDHRADLYAIGVMLYEMLTLELPISSTSYIATIRRKLVEDPTPPSQREGCGHLSPAVDGLVLHALARDPEARFSSVTQLRAALERELAAHPLDLPSANHAPSSHASFSTDSGAVALAAPAFSPPAESEGPRATLNTVGIDDTLPAQPVIDDLPPPDRPAVPGQPVTSPAYAVHTFSAPTSPPLSPAPTPSASPRRGLWVLALLAALVFVCLASAATAWFLASRAPDPPPVGQRPCVGQARA